MVAEWLAVHPPSQPEGLGLIPRLDKNGGVRTFSLMSVWVPFGCSSFPYRKKTMFQDKSR